MIIGENGETKLRVFVVLVVVGYVELFCYDQFGLSSSVNELYLKSPKGV